MEDKDRPQGKKGAETSGKQPDKAQEEGGGSERARRAEPDLRVFVAGLYAGALVALGEVEHPLTGEKKLDMREAQYLIDTIAMLREKTRGNLTADEQHYLDNALHDLRLRYVSVAGSSPTDKAGPAGQEQKDPAE